MKLSIAHGCALMTLFFASFVFAMDAQKPLKKVYIYPGYHYKLFDETTDAYGMRAMFHKLGYEPYEARSLAHLDNPDLIICFDIPFEQLSSLIKYDFGRLILFIFEPPSVVKQNFETGYHTFFNEVYTWNDEWVKAKSINYTSYFKFYQPTNVKPMITDVIDFDAKKFCAIVMANKSSDHKLQLYSERLKVVEFFDRYHPDELDFYGVNWGNAGLKHRTFKGSISETPLYEDIFMQCVCPESLRTTVKRGNGELEDCIAAGCQPYGKKVLMSTFTGTKIDALKHYKFCFCYENTKNVPGYITEKILECMQAGCVPIYWGAPNIESHIPKGCYILKTDFPTYEALYDFLKNMSKETYQTYLENIRAYLASDAPKVYSEESFRTVIEEMIKRHELRNSL
jgi:hypothetical protein